MATIPNHVKTNTSVDVLNAIRNASSQNYQNYVPIATPDAEVIKSIGAVIMDYPAIQNEFLSALINRIARVYITSRSYENPWKFFKKGVLEYGESIEEIFVNLAKPFQFDQETAETELYKRVKPDVRSAFHLMNYQKFYKVTISDDQLRQAFLSSEGVADLIAKITETLVTAMNYDEFCVMKYMLARRALDGLMYTTEIPDVTTANMDEIIGTVKGISNDFTFMKTKYNLAGVYTHSNKERQYILINSKFDAKMDVEVLAAAFNMAKAEFFGHRVLVDSFGDVDNARLAELFKDDSTYTALTDAEVAALDSIPCMIVDEDFFQIYDNMQKFTENYNGQGLYWNYFLHAWKTFSVSPFANNCVFVSGDTTVDSVTVSPSTATVVAGGSVQLTANVTGSSFANKGVVWTVTGSVVTVSENGLVTVSSDAKSGTSADVTAMSVIDNSVYGKATITVA